MSEQQRLLPTKTDSTSQPYWTWQSRQESTTNSTTKNNSSNNQVDSTTHNSNKRTQHTRSATVGIFGSTTPPKGSHQLPIKPHSIGGDGKISFLTHVEWGQHEIYTQVPFTAVWGLHTKERSVRRAFAMYAATLNLPQANEQQQQQQLSEWDEHHRRQASIQASEVILNQLEEADAPERGLTWSFIMAVVVATASQFSVGYNTGVMNAPEKVVFPGHTTAMWSLAVAAFAVGGPFGAVVGGKLADSQGRRGALWIDILVFFVGGLWQTLAVDMTSIIASRFCIGFGSGISSVLVPIYLGELAPPRLRGALGTLTQFAMVIGILVSDVLAFSFATEGQWRWLFAVTPAVALFQMIASPFFLLESPRWLLSRDPKSSLARAIIRKIRGLERPTQSFDGKEYHESDPYFSEVEREVLNYLAGEAAQHQDEQKSTVAILGEMISDPHIRLLLVSSLFLQMCQQFSGINAVFYYSTSFFEGVIDNPLVGTTIVGAVNVVATYAALLLMDICGRRTLLLWSSGGMFVSCVVIVFSLLGGGGDGGGGGGGGHHGMALVAVTTYVTCFEIGLGPIPWLIVAEMFDGKYVATAMSLCSQLNWACNFIVGLVFPYLNEYLGPLSFVPFATILACAFLYTWLILPEPSSHSKDENFQDPSSYGGGVSSSIIMEEGTTNDDDNNV